MVPVGADIPFDRYMGHRDLWVRVPPRLIGEMEGVPVPLFNHERAISR